MLADANAVHTIRWVKGLAHAGLSIRLFSLNRVDDETNYKIPGVEVEQFGLDRDLISSKSSNVMKISYLKVLLRLRKTIADFKPDILHAHYASSYGLLGALSGFHPLVVSVWGSDVFSFPCQSAFHRSLLKFNLKKADRISSTSNAMAEETSKYTSKQITVIPFGIDPIKFRPQPVESIFKQEDIVIGTIKSLEPVYGIDYLIRAFGLLKERHPELPLKLLIVGDGSQEVALKSMVNDLGLAGSVVFAGRVDPEELPRYHNMIHIFAALSLQESFGVSILEASACSRPVVVSNAGGLPEVVNDGETGIVVPVKDEQAAFRALEKLLIDQDLAQQMGENGRKRVEHFYSWENNVVQMTGMYREMLESKS